MKQTAMILGVLVGAVFARCGSALEPNLRCQGYQGIWFSLGQQGDFGDKYSGGLGTYTAKHRPIAIYSPKADKTFFVYGGTKVEKQHLLNMIGYYDHATGFVPKPVIVHDKMGVIDPHDNASLAIDGDGHLWVFVSGRGRSRPGLKYRSRKPFDINSFDRISEEEFTYPQPLWVPGQGFLHCFTKYTNGRELYWNTSEDGRVWTADRKLAGMGGHYQMVECQGNRVLVAFNYHPGKNTVDRRTNLYFVYTDDRGATWRTIQGEVIKTPMTDPKCAALVRDYQSEDKLVYLKDLQFDADGNPVILIVTSAHHMPGPAGDPRAWTIVRWDGTQWLDHQVTTSTHNYDMGQLWIEGDSWRIVAPTEPGPQHWGAGGEVAMWESRDLGRTWGLEKLVTSRSQRNHTYVRRPLHAHSEFYALWADGDPAGISPSHLYFLDRDTSQVRQLPYVMRADFERPLVDTQVGAR
jgi:hypothetical protein